MPVMSDDVLRERAKGLARDHLEPMFRDPLIIEAEEGETEWSEMICRNVYEQDFAIWRTIGEVELETDAQGRVVRFNDSSRLEAVSGKHVAEPSESVLRDVAQTTGLVSPHARIVEVAKVAAGMLEVGFNQYVPDFPASLTIKIDVKRERVIALDVTEWDEP